MKDLRRLVTAKSASTLFMHPNDTTEKALLVMLTAGDDAVLVRRGFEAIGIISERDFLRCFAFGRRELKNTHCKEIMTCHLFSTTTNDTLENCLMLMIDKKIKHLPILENKRALALLSLEDVIKALVEDREFMIDELTKYITGSFFREDIFGLKLHLAMERLKENAVPKEPALARSS